MGEVCNGMSPEYKKSKDESGKAQNIKKKQGWIRKLGIQGSDPEVVCDTYIG